MYEFLKIKVNKTSFAHIIQSSTDNLSHIYRDRKYYLSKKIVAN